MSGSLIFNGDMPAPTPVTTLRANLVSAVTAAAPGITTDLPASMIEDMVSTGTAILATIDQARVDAVNSVSPYGANAFLLPQFGSMFGIAQGAASNTSAYVIFPSTSVGPTTPGIVIPAGTLVSDGTNTYATQTATVTGSSGYTPAVLVVAVNAGSFPVPANSITQVKSALGNGITTCYNPNSGTPSVGAQTIQSYRQQIMQAFSSIGVGQIAYLLTQLQNVAGVIPRLTSVLQASGGWEIICSGGDPYAMAFAIYSSVLDLTSIVGSSISSSRDTTVSIVDAGNTYSVTFVTPPQQLAGISISWNTTASGFTAGPALAQAGSAAIVAYVNGIQVGQPLNLLMLTEAFQQATNSILPNSLLTTFDISITVNGTATSPTPGTSVIPGDPESYFYTTPGNVTITQE